eukprot:3302140-Amphidinium_carterae.1
MFYWVFKHSSIILESPFWGTNPLCTIPLGVFFLSLLSPGATSRSFRAATQASEQEREERSVQEDTRDGLGSHHYSRAAGYDSAPIAVSTAISMNVAFPSKLATGMWSGTVLSKQT